MKKSIYILLFILVGALFFMLYRHGTQKKIWSENTPLSEFMIGKWKSSKSMSDIDGSFLQEYHLEFLNQNKLKLCIKTRELFCDDYTYQLISDSTFSIESDRDKRGQWNISRRGDDLWICIKYSDCLLFTRDDS